MKLEDNKKEIDEWFDSHTPEELQKKWEKYSHYSGNKRPLHLLYTQLCGDSEPLVCPDCKQPFTKEEIAIKEHCNNCGWEFAN
jgi:uncharacterized CHY-type Zn-finger protein